MSCQQFENRKAGQDGETKRIASGVLGKSKPCPCCRQFFIHDSDYKEVAATGHDGGCNHMSHYCVDEHGTKVRVHWCRFCGVELSAKNHRYTRYGNELHFPNGVFKAGICCASRGN
mmetsp:Transcript_30122/g.48350  ORF Transcript_30122/g.48350 Transcript_30122/m.48350 type:complete len:116 (+) Transcript_30122:1308-1655(+)